VRRAPRLTVAAALAAAAALTITVLPVAFVTVIRCPPAPYAW
jgi:hypothetical protein